MTKAPRRAVCDVDAFAPNVDFAWVRTSLPLPVSFSVVPTLRALQCMMTFCFAYYASKRRAVN